MLSPLLWLLNPGNIPSWVQLTPTYLCVARLVKFPLKLALTSFSAI